MLFVLSRVEKKQRSPDLESNRKIWQKLKQAWLDACFFSSSSLLLPPLPLLASLCFKAFSPSKASEGISTGPSACHQWFLVGFGGTSVGSKKIYFRELHINQDLMAFDLDDVFSCCSSTSSRLPRSLTVTQYSVILSYMFSLQQRRKWIERPGKRWMVLCEVRIPSLLNSGLSLHHCFTPAILCLNWGSLAKVQVGSEKAST